MIDTGLPPPPSIYQGMPPPPPPREPPVGIPLHIQSSKKVEENAFKLTIPQWHFVNSNAKFPAMVAGYGAGKTEGGLIRVLKKKLDYPKNNVGYYLPTYDLIKQIIYPRLEQILSERDIPYFLNETDKVCNIYGAGKIIMRTMDRPESIVGYEHADAVADEIDVMATDKAADVWRKIVARNRQKKADGTRNTLGVATTPEGFKFVYDKWKRNPMVGSQIIKASTMSNAANLPEDYVDTLRDVYPDQMLEAYLNGEFVNMTQGAVYPDFDRDLNGSNAVALKGETLHIGVDFNVGKMSGIVHVLRETNPHAVDEFVKLLDTPALIRAIRSKYVEIDKPCQIICYPDASGKSRKTVNATESDLSLLRQAGFTVLANSKNPFIKDRVASFNKMIHKDGERRYKVNSDRCPHLVECLEQQAYNKNGEPDKTSDFDHAVDGAGYFIAYRYPVVRNRGIQTKVTGL